MNIAFQIIDHLKTALDHLRPLASTIVENLREDLIVRWPYDSNAIEGNTLTLREPKEFLALIADIVKDSFPPYWHSLRIQAPKADPS